MRHSFLPRLLVMLVSSLGLIVGCSGASDDGGLPATRAGSPEEIADIQKQLEQEKVAGGSQYKAPPGIQIPKK